MGKDFGNMVLPLGENHYLDLEGDAPKSLITWGDILHMSPYLLDEVERYGLPIWSPGSGYGGRQVMILYLPKSSAMGRTWAADMRSQWTPLGDVLWASNTTMPLAKRTSPMSGVAGIS